MDREADRLAFARAGAYLNYHRVAKWVAVAAGALTGVVYVLLLVVLWLFADYAIHRGRIPAFRNLPTADQVNVLEDWKRLSSDDRAAQLRNVGYGDSDIQAIAELDPSEPPPSDVAEQVWRAHVGGILRQRGFPNTAERLRPDQTDYDLDDHGLLSLVVRTAIDHRMVTPVLAALASWNHWMTTRYLPWGLFVIALVLAVAAFVLTVLNREMAARACIEAAVRLRRGIYHHTFRLGTLAFRALGPTEAVTVFTRHVEAVHDALFVRLTVLVRESVLFVLLLLFALFVHPWLALAFLCFAVLLWLIGGQIATHFRRRARAAGDRAAEHLTVIRESLMLMRLVKCYLMDLFNQSRVERQLSRYSLLQMIRYRAEAITRPLFVLLSLICAIVLLYVAGLIVQNGHLGVAGLIVLATALVSLYRPFERILEARRVLRRGRESAVQVFKFIDRRGEVGQVVGAEFLPPMTKQLEFDNVSLKEPGGSRKLLEDISLTIPAGKRIGLLGADDLEKHALVYLIPRLLDPTSGEIRIDEHNLRWVTLDSLRTQIATVLQHNLVFHDTVANNIGCGDPAYTLPKIIEAAKMAHAHHFIQKLPHGYETAIGELGHALGPTEQFRIALARAILRDPALIIIEEPENSLLDDDTKDLLDDTMARFLPGRTAIFLPHRISTIKSCDRLYLLHKGKIEASGVHKELLAANQLYRHLYYIEFNEMDE